MINPLLHRLTVGLQRISQLVRNWKVRQGGSMRENIYVDTPSGFQEKARNRGDWLKLEAKWMGGEGDCRDVT